jgi:hypothetical protein
MCEVSLLICQPELPLSLKNRTGNTFKLAAALYKAKFSFKSEFVSIVGIEIPQERGKLKI